MHLKSICLSNFRRLKNVTIDLDPKTSIFVGANNSGKTSVMHALSLFLAEGGSKGKFSIHDFSADCWDKFSAYPSGILQDPNLLLPVIAVDLWFEVKSNDLYRIIELLPSLDWDGVPIGVRIEYAAKNPEMLISNFLSAQEKSNKNNKDGYEPWPHTLTDYLEKMLPLEFQLNYYVLDHARFNDDLIQEEDYQPLKLGDENTRSGARILNSLIRIDFLDAQRHLSDSKSSGRSEDLSKRMNRFYERNLQKREDDFDAMKALANSESEMTKHLAHVFKPTLDNLNTLGYPGFGNPQLVIKAALNYENIVSQTKLHYSLNSDTSSNAILPDTYNGLGFKNLIYMVIELLDFHSRWVDDEDQRAPLHLIVIEEPEAHLHAQLQQIFIKQVWGLLEKQEPGSVFENQLIITTHSPHIIYESGFLPIRYFSRCVSADKNQISKVLNLSIFYNNSEKMTRDFLQQYMKLTHCDLFFADAVILVEGNVERLLLPLMINKCAPALQTNYLSILEVGGASHIILSN